MTETLKTPRKRKSQCPFSNELLDQILAQTTGKDAESNDTHLVMLFLDISWVDDINNNVYYCVP